MVTSPAVRFCGRIARSSACFPTPPRLRRHHPTIVTHHRQALQSPNPPHLGHHQPLPEPSRTMDPRVIDKGAQWGQGPTGAPKPGQRTPGRVDIGVGGGGGVGAVVVLMGPGVEPREEGAVEEARGHPEQEEERGQGTVAGAFAQGQKGRCRPHLLLLLLLLLRLLGFDYRRLGGGRGRGGVRVLLLLLLFLFLRGGARSRRRFEGRATGCSSGGGMRGDARICCP